MTIHATGAATGIPSRHTTGKCGPDRPALLAQLDITLADGTVRTVATDGEWRSGIGPECGSDLYDGETYDARLELGGWSRPEDITAVVLHSDMVRTGWFECSEPQVNQLHQNIVWGMRGNFLDVPTDCPQRDERLGWTGTSRCSPPPLPCFTTPPPC